MLRHLPNVLHLLCTFTLWLTVANPTYASDLSALESIPASEISTQIGQAQYNRRTGQYTYELSVLNIGAKTISGPIVVIPNIYPNSVQLDNANGIFSNGREYIETGVAELAVGQKFTTRLLVTPSGRTRISFSPEIYARPNDVNGIATVGQAGGTVEVKDPRSPIFGARLTLEPNSIYSGEVFSLDYTEVLPAPLPASIDDMGVVILSKILKINRTGSDDFGLRARVLLPIDFNLLNSGEVPIVVHWDEEIQSYTPVEVVEVNRNGGYLIFETAHASAYVALTLKRIGEYLLSASEDEVKKIDVDSGFRPDADGFYIRNFGSYYEPGGQCFAYAAYSAWYFAAARSLGGALYGKYREGDLSIDRDDFTAIELTTRAYVMGNPNAHIASLNRALADKRPSVDAHRDVGLTLLMQLLVTKKPQILTFTEISGTNAHAVTVYGYDTSTEKFYFYDNNQPGAIRSVKWNYERGFSENQSNKIYTYYAFSSFNSAYSSKSLLNLFSEAESGFKSSIFTKINVTNPPEVQSSPNLFFIPDPSQGVTLRGVVPRPAGATRNVQRYMHVWSNGVKVSHGEAVDQSADTFEVNVGILPKLEGTEILMFVSEDPVRFNKGIHAFKRFVLAEQNCIDCVYIRRVRCKGDEKSGYTWSIEGFASSTVFRPAPIIVPNTNWDGVPYTVHCSNWTSSETPPDFGQYPWMSKINACKKADLDPPSTNWSIEVHSQHYVNPVQVFLGYFSEDGYIFNRTAYDWEGQIWCPADIEFRQ